MYGEFSEVLTAVTDSDRFNKFELIRNKDNSYTCVLISGIAVWSATATTATEAIKKSLTEGSEG